MGYLEERRALKLGQQPAPANDKKALKAWYDKKLRAALAGPLRCEECGDPLRESMMPNPRAIICHIVAKSKKNGCPEVETEEENAFLGCWACHGFYDTASSAEIKKMRIFSILKMRVLSFWDKILPQNRRRVPECLRP